jgi:hypothetical protein
LSVANPAVVTVPDVTGIVAGDIAMVTGTGSDLDGKSFIVGTVDGGANTFELQGADTTGWGGTLDASPSVEVYSASDGIIICLASIDIGAPSVNQVDVSTFCDPSASLPGTTTPGTVTLTGYLDKDASGLAELIKAADDGESRVFFIELSNDQGYIMGELAFAGFAFTIPIEGGYGYTVTGTQTTPLKWFHD